MNKYDQLAVDLREAQAEANALYSRSEDGGTCNLDAITLNLRGWRQKEAKEAIVSAGMNAWKHSHGYFVVNPRTVFSQGNRNTRICQAVSDHMKAKGYDAGMYFMVD